MSKEAMKLALEKFANVKALCDKHGGKINRKHVYGGALIEHFDVVCQALAQQPAQQEPVQQGILARKWILHGSFADVASFDSEGVPSFYGRESVAKFQKGQLSEPCKGKNCGSLNGWLHSAECRAEHEEHYTSPQAQRKPLTLGQKQRLWSSVGDKPTLKDRVNAYGTAIEAAHGIKGDT